MQAKEYMADGTPARQIAASATDIAVVGMACRFPCAADYHEYWQNLVSGRNCIREVPGERWNWRDYSSDSRLGPSAAGGRWGGFIDDMDKFDPLFFGISPSEAAFIDPQHRLFLEAAWHAVEDAGYSVASLSGRTIGVYAGVSKNDYSELMRESRHEIAPYISTGTVHSILVNRVSFLFNLHGKSEAVDTACSSSLVALHNAIRDIASGDCEAAIVGGVNALITPTMFVSHGKSGMLSPDGQCKTFSAGANGYVRSEGVGVLFIKPLRQALIDGDHVHAVIKSTAINHGGRTNFLTSPNTEAQAAVVVKSLRSGNIDPRSIDYVEAHGTGTPLGDPIEINALKKAFAQLDHEFSMQADRQEPRCALGSAKTNVGHLESASGMAGIIKVIMSMKHRQIPAIRNFDELNPYIELHNSPFYIATETIAWETKEQPRRAGVSSFGMGGVNAHVVLEEAPATAGDPVAEERDFVIPLSAKKGRLKPYAESLLVALGQDRGETASLPTALRDIAYTLQTGRDGFDERVAFVAGSLDELIVNLEQFVAGAGSGSPNIFVGNSLTSNEAGLHAVGGKRSARATDLAAQWTHGAKIDWRSLYGGSPARRVPLPTYPFARKRCWFTDHAAKTSVVDPVAAASSVEANGFVRAVKATDFFIRDHVVQGRRMLPAVAHLEFARAAATVHADHSERVRVLKDIYWIAPVVVDDKDVHVEVVLTPNAESLKFEIRQGQTVHSKGSLTDRPPYHPDFPKQNISAVQSRCRPGRNKVELYAWLRQHGLAYGSSFQVIERFVHGDREILAELRLGEVPGGLTEYVLHPSIMDGVFQAVTALSLLGAHEPGPQFVPFYLEAAEILSTPGKHCFVHATVNTSGTHVGALASFDAVLCDLDGNVLVNIRNLQKRPIVQKQASETAPARQEVMYYRPSWQSRALVSQPAHATESLLLFAHDQDAVESFRRFLVTSRTIVLVRPGSGYCRVAENVYEIRPDELADHEALMEDLKTRGLPPVRVVYLWSLGVHNETALRSALETTLYGVLSFTQAAFKAKLHETVRLVYVHASGAGFTSCVHSMVAGFARTLRYENPGFNYVTLGLDDLNIEEVARAACAELGAPDETTLREVVYRGADRHVRTITQETIPEHWEAADLGRSIRPGGVYLISGGGGGLGSLFSQYLAEKYAATILWLGRSAMSPAIASRIRTISQAGGMVEYFTVDISDGEALTAIFSEIKVRHREINGVIHAAGVIEDAFILRKRKDSFARVVEPKVLGAINLDEVTRHEKLDFFAVFSSIAALMPNQGQSDYAAANSFLDSFTEVRNRLSADNRRSGVSLALNWPLWETGGMRVTPEEKHHLEKVFGMRPLPTTDGLAIFETSLALARDRFPDINQLIAIGGDREKVERRLGVDASVNCTKEGEATTVAVALLEAEIRSILAFRLRLQPETITAERNIGEFGVSSSTAVGVTQDLNARFDAELKPTLLFDINTVGKLAAHLIAIGKNKVALPAHKGTPKWNQSLIDLSGSDPARLKFSRTFKTSEFYLRDHVVDGQYNMPGACYVEMARQASDLAFGDEFTRKLSNNYWASPLSSSEEDFTAHVHITAKLDHLTYEIVSFTAAGERRLHAMGQIMKAGPAPRVEMRIDLSQVMARCHEIRYPVEIYGQIRGEGLTVGPTFQPMKRIFLNDTEALGVLELPDAIQSTIGDYVLNPALLTGAFQTALISNKRGTANDRWYIPIGMDEIEVMAPIPAECFVYCRPREVNRRNAEMRKFDLEICRPDGLVVVKLIGFGIRALKEVPKSAESSIRAAGYSPICEVGPATLSAIQHLIKSKLAGPIGLPVEELDVSVDFDRYGVTSVMIVGLNEIFEDILGPIPKTLFFEYRNIKELAEYFAQHHADALSRVLGRRQESPTDPTGALTASEESSDRIDEVRDYLRYLIARPVGLSADELDDYTGFDQYGINSVMVVELNEIFESIFGPLSKTLFFEYRSIDELGRYFLDTHRSRILSALPIKQSVDRGLSNERLRGTDEDGSRGGRPGAGSLRGAVSGGGDDRRDIAIVSAAGRFPGARNLKEFWDVLREGRDCITEIPEDRFNYRKYFDADPEQNRIYGKWGGFIDDVDCFDPAFFQISPREAELIDPQERLLLEVVWEMLEHAGYTRQRLLRLTDRQVGVFVGALWQPYESAGIEATAAGNVVGPSSLLYSIANRLSYFLDLGGPSMAIDTACSSSLTALHLACQSIRTGESRSAIVAGVNLSLTVSKYLFLSRNRFLSTDGRCRSYGAGGDGYVPGEGVCSLLLKPLANAIADADSILAVIKGSAINHGGRTNGYTVPNPKAQGNVIAHALEQSGIDRRAISYIEGHGTGTSLGDPIEMAGLGKALGLATDADRFCAIGSVKSNIGHLEAAAGVASIIKVILQMQHGQLAPSIHAEQLNPNIDFGTSQFRVQRELAPWPRREFINAGKREQTPRTAGVSSFGAGGSNAHLIMEEYVGTPSLPLRGDGDRSAPALFVFSARTEERLFELAGRFRNYLGEMASDDLYAVAHTLQLGREEMRERLAVVACNVEELRASLTGFVERQQGRDNWRRGRAASGGGHPGGIAEIPFETLEAWWKEKTLIPLAEAWVRGLPIDWMRFYGGRNYKFLPLPTYPFAKERYWIDMAASEQSSATAGSSSPSTIPFLHPLLHLNTSDLTVHRYRSTFNGNEFFLADHLVRTDGGTVQKVLPGVAYLEMARAAIEKAMPAPPELAVLELLNTVWAQPIVVTGTRQVSIEISAKDNHRVEYEIFSQEQDAKVIHCQGRAAWIRPPASASIDLERVTRQMGRGKVEQDVYASFARMGIVLGPAFQAITDIHMGIDQLLAHVRVPRTVEAKATDYVLHPSLMDGALQGSLGLIDGWFESSEPRWPFALESLQVLSPCTREMVSWMRYAEGSHPGDAVIKLDVDLCDERGRVCVRMRGFTSRTRGLGEGVKGRFEDVREHILQESKDAMGGLAILAPVWEPVSLEAGDLASEIGERVVVIGGEADQHRRLRQECGRAEVLNVDAGATVEEIAQSMRGGARIDHVVWILPGAIQRGGESEGLIEDQNEGVLRGFRLIKALLGEGYGARELGWTVITNQTQRIGELREEVDVAHSSVEGLVGSMAKEYANWKVRLVDVGAGLWPWGEMLRLRRDELGNGWAYRTGQWYRRRLVECELGGRESHAGGFKRGGVYVVVGGAGGVGEVLSEYLIANYEARVVWIGRRESNDLIDAKLARLAVAGGERPFYMAADARKREELERACREIRERYGRIDGVIHSAIVLADKSLANMGEEQFRAALSAKVDVAVRLEQVFGREPLDFILYFSSLQTFLKAPGQSNYAAGCAFTDAFAQWQSSKADYAVKVMNWGYWGRVGVAVGADYRERMARMGWGSIEAEEGMAALERLLQGPLQQLGLIRTTGVEAKRALGVTAGRERILAAQKAATTMSSSDTYVGGDPGLLSKIETWLVQAAAMLLKLKKDDVDPDAELNAFGFDSVSLTSFANYVNQSYGLELMPTILFEHPTMRRFARHLVENYRAQLIAYLEHTQAAGTARVPRSLTTADPPIASPASESREASGLVGKTEEWLADAVGVLLKVKKESVDLDAQLSEFGFDSVSLTGFANHVNQAYGLELMPTVFFEHSTPRTFARYLVEKHGDQLSQRFRAGTGIQPADVRAKEWEEKTSKKPLLSWGEGPKRKAAQPVQKVAGRSRAEDLEATGNGSEPIAIIGMSGRFPGAEDLDRFWENLKAGKSSIREIPRERWDWRALLEDDREDGNRGSVKWGAFMDGVDEFDPLFFGISPREAELIDPQQRLIMMYGWKAFEDAGYGPKQLWGSQTGIFIGTASTGYGELLMTQAGTGIEGYTATGLVPSVGPNRLSYLLNLHGPSEPIETACSSSLVAVHRAVRSIIAGESEIALAGGVNTLFPTLHISFGKAGMLSRDGKCKTFSSLADGYVRGEGVGMVVLKKLSMAERDRDHIYGLIRGSAENHGGRAQSLTAPNPQAQSELIKDAYRRAAVSPRSVSYIEAHGTGTPLGDPVEINGLKSAFEGLCEERGEKPDAGYCGLGSVKTNIGHLELAAGIAGLIKIVLQLKHKTLVQSLHCDQVNPYIKLEGSPFYIVTENRPWERLRDGEGRERPLRAGVSSFGFGGVNAHVVVEEYAGGSEFEDEAKKDVGTGQAFAIVLSAKGADRLKELATQLRRAILQGEMTDGDLAGMAYTLQLGREAMDHRLGTTVRSMEELERKLCDFVEGKSGTDGLYLGEVRPNGETQAVFRNDEELLEAVGKWMHRGKWPKLLELWVKGLDVEWEQLYGEVKPFRMSLPTYPFARERYWIDTITAGHATANGSGAVLHPLLHCNTSDLAGQRYSTTFTGEEFFLRDHRVRLDGYAAKRVLPGVAYLEMARAATEKALPIQPKERTLELLDTVWLKPIVVEDPKQVSIVLSADDDGPVFYEILSMDEGRKTIHCQGQAVYRDRSGPVKLDVRKLEEQMTQGAMEPLGVYTLLAGMGFDYGPAHQVITSIHMGERQLMAQLRLPRAVEATDHEFLLHPSSMDGALQASIFLLIDLNHPPVKPPVPFALESLHIVSACTREMTAWVRYQGGGGKAESRAIKLDIDLCDAHGNVCVQMRAFSSRAFEGDLKAAHESAATGPVRMAPDHIWEASAIFDDAFYENLVADIANGKVSVDEAVEFG